MKRLLVGFTLLPVALLIYSLALADGNTLYVDAANLCDGNTPCYTHVQDAVNAASPGDTILVYPGTYSSRYFECPWAPNCSCSDNYSPALIVYKDDLTIQAIDPDPANTVIQSTHTCWSNAIAVENSTANGVIGVSGWAPNASVIVANDVTIEGFTFHRPFNCASTYDCFWNTAGVFIGSKGAGYSDFLGSANGATVQNNVFSDVWHAVYIWHSDHNTIAHNTVEALGDTSHWAAIESYDGYDDTQIGYGNLSSYNVICHNALADKGIGIGAWAPPTWTDNTGNLICHNTATSIGAYYSAGLKRFGCNQTPAGDPLAPWTYNASDYTNVTGITYAGASEFVADPLTGLATVLLRAQLEYAGDTAADLSVTFLVEGIEYVATTAADGSAETTVELAPGAYPITLFVEVCADCTFSAEATLTVLPAPTTVKVDDDWVNASPGEEVFPDYIFGYNAFSTVQEGVDAVALGGKVWVLEGVYEEQVVIAGKNMTLAGLQDDEVVIRAVSDQTGPIIWAQDADSIIVRDLTIDGAGHGYPGCVSGDDRFFGIYYLNAGGRVQRNQVMGIKHPAGYEGCQSGVGIYALSQDGSPYTLWIEYNTVQDFQKNGITINGEGTTAYVKGNQVYGWGPTPLIAQNGIQLGSGAAGDIYGNNQVTGIAYTGDYWAASGYLLYGSGSAKVRNNRASDSQVALYVAWSDGAIVNTMQLSRGEYGVIAAESHDLKFERNRVQDFDYGVYLWESDNARLANNQVLDNGDGIFVDTCDGALALKNVIKRNQIGIHLYCATNFKQVKNQFAGNDQNIVDEGCPAMLQQTLGRTQTTLFRLAEPFEP